MGRKTILLVENDAVIRDIIKSAFEREYNVIETPGCSEAIKVLGNPIDIALIDYMLPDGDGFDVLRTIRDMKSNLPVIILTAYGSEDVVVKALRAGATDYIKKPLVLASLRIKVADILAGKRGVELSGNSENINNEEFLLDGVAIYIENNYSDELTRDMLSERICMNKYKFSKIFNDRFGQSIKSYINNIRIKKAAELLKNNGHLRIAEIAVTVGYKNIMHFERVFKEIYGVSPKEYRSRSAYATPQCGHLWLSD
jgi:YesN/AraC family two-component response regulator